MATEIERKFLVNHQKLPTTWYNTVYITQGYLLDKPVVRIRVIDNWIGPKTAKLTFKGYGTVSRKEYEFNISAWLAAFLLMFVSRKIEKFRHYMKSGEHIWEVDQFQGNLTGLWIAEVELSSVDEHFELPDFVIDEVTEDVRYANSNLVKFGIPK